MENSPKEDAKLESVKKLFEDDVAYRIYIITNFRDMSTQITYQQKMIEKQTKEMEDINEAMKKLINEHAVCTERVLKTSDFEETWKWSKRIKEECNFEESWHWAKRVKIIWEEVRNKILVVIIVALLGFLVVLYASHNHVKITTEQPGGVKSERVEGITN